MIKNEDPDVIALTQKTIYKKDEKNRRNIKKHSENDE